MTYTVKELFKTVQGEGANIGKTAVFCRFAGCNLWTGREADRPSAVCRFCDTDFVGVGEDGGKFAHAADLALAIATLWGEGEQHRFVVLTGGEPLLQVDAALIDELHKLGFHIAIETNGTLPVPPGIDWVCVSPKAGAPLVVTAGDELKVVFPQDGQDLDALARLAFTHMWLQPMDGPLQRTNTRLAIERVMSAPQWRLATQTHKLIGVR